MTPTLAKGKICYIEMPASDIQRSAEFYEKVFVCRIRQRVDGAIAFDEVVVQESGTWITGWPTSTPGLLIYIMVDSVAAPFDYLIAPGA